MPAFFNSSCHMYLIIAICKFFWSKGPCYGILCRNTHHNKKKHAKYDWLHFFSFRDAKIVIIVLCFSKFYTNIAKDSWGFCRIFDKSQYLTDKRGFIQPEPHSLTG